MRKKKPEEPIAEIAMREFESFALGTAAGGKRRQVVMDQALMKRLAIKGLAMVLYLCNTGNYRAAQYLVDRCLGTADQPFSERIAQMSPEEAKQALHQEYCSMGLAPEVAYTLVEAAVKGEAPNLPPGAFDGE